MIHSITGTIAAVSDGLLLLKTDGGIEWSLFISSHTATELPGAGMTVRIFTHLHHKEDQMSLYGFASQTERSVFLDLMKVGGIGTRQALRILSGMSVERLIQCLDAEDVDALATIPGLGKKTAQKMLLTLRGKLSIASHSDNDPHDEIVDALIDMGFDRGKAKTAVAAIRSEKIDQEETEGELLRRAIVRLSAQQ